MKKSLLIALLFISIIIFIIFLTHKNINNQNINELTEIDKETEVDNISETENEIVNENGDSAVTNTETTNIEDNTKTTSAKTIKEEASPSGFAGSSMYKVILYSNGEVFVEAYDGEGYQEKNIISKNLIARNGVSVKKANDEERYGMVIVKAEEILDRNIGWIEFE